MNYTLLENKFLLIDTNILIDYSKYPIFFTSFIKNLRAYNVNLVVDQTVRFEFMRTANSTQKEETLKEFINFFLDKGKVELPINDATVAEAIQIANIYAWKNTQKIELADCFLASAMRKFNEGSSQPRLYLATQNHKDFPKYIFKRVGIETIDIKQENIINIGFYEFDNEAFKTVEDAYNRT